MLDNIKQMYQKYYKRYNYGPIGHWCQTILITAKWFVSSQGNHTVISKIETKYIYKKSQTWSSERIMNGCARVFWWHYCYVYVFVNWNYHKFHNTKFQPLVNSWYGQQLYSFIENY